MFVPRQQYPRELKIAVMREIDSGESTAELARSYQLGPMLPRLPYSLCSASFSANTRRKLVVNSLLAGIMAQQIFTRLLQSLTEFGVAS